MNRHAVIRSAAAMLAATLSGLSAAAQEDRFAGVEVAAMPISGPVHMLVGAGGNIGVSVGDDGTLIIDDQFAPLADRITAALQGLGGDRPRLVLNTHFHGDHTGGNPLFGRSATIVAHHSVRVRLAAQADFPRAGLPVLTFADRVEVHFNGDTIEVLHLPAGHTDGDSVVWFKGANVAHLGDLLFHGTFPFIDTANGGSVPGVIVNLTRLLDLLPDDVRIIPGHGPLATKQAIRDTLEMIRATRGEVMTALGNGHTVEQIVAAGLDDRWATWGAGFINEERWIRTLAATPGSG
jgi:cyclase